MIKCPECGRQVSDHAKMCPSCGIEISGNIKQCLHCGGVAASFQDVCPVCGMSFVEPSVVDEPSVVEFYEEASDTVPTPEPEPIAPEPTPVVVAPAAPQKANLPEPPKAPRRSPRKPPIAPPRKKEPKKNSWKMILTAFVIAVVLVGCGLFFYFSSQSEDEHRAYRDAMNSTASPVLENYLAIYKDAPADHRDSVVARLTSLRGVEVMWDSIRDSGSREEYENFISRYPASDYVREATMKIDSLDWMKADATATFESYSAYKKAHPDGLFFDMASEKAEKLDPKNVTYVEERAVKDVLAKYFKAVAANDEKGLKAVLDSVMPQYLGMENVNIHKAVNHMRRLNANVNGAKVGYIIKDDSFELAKLPVDGKFEWKATFNVDRRLTAVDPTKSTQVTYRTEVGLSANMKINKLLMEKI